MSGTPHTHPTPPETTPSEPNRRQFLLRAAGGAALALPVAAMARDRAAPISADAGPDWGQLERVLKGKLLRPDSEGYEEAVKVWNLRFAATKPAGVAFVVDAQDIATAIAWAQDNRVDMVSRSGGHSYAGYSTTPGLVINLREMTKVTVDPAAGTMTTHGAATNQDVADAGKPFGRAIPGGQCPTVGVAGFVLGGGLGFYMRQHGLAIDRLQSTEIVTADGRRHHVTEDKDERPKKDLFWALCGGGGGNFGINTSFTFRTFVVPPQVTFFSLKWYSEDCIRAFLAFQEVVRSAPDTLGTIAHFGRDPAMKLLPYLRVFGQVVESKDAVNRLLAPVMAAVKPAEKPDIQEQTFWDAKYLLGGGKIPPTPNGFLERSRFHPRPLTEQAVAAIVTAIARAPIENTNHSVSSSLFAWGGKVARRSSDATAFAHRKDFWLQSFDCSWGKEAGPARDSLRVWLNRFYDDMGAHSSDRCYVNFADPQLQCPLPAYYGENLPGLIEVKKKYDPHNVFTFDQSIHG